MFEFSIFVRNAVEKVEGFECFQLLYDDEILSAIAGSCDVERDNLCQ